MRALTKLFLAMCISICTVSCMCSNRGFVFDNAYKKFIGTYEVDLTIMQSGHITTIVVNPNGTCYFKEGDSRKMRSWWPADNGGGIQFSSNGLADPEKGGYFMNKKRTKMYWGIDDYLDDKNGYKVKKVK